MPFIHTVLITGGTANLGFYCALTIAREHPEYLIVIASRTDPNSAAEKINKTLGQENVKYLPLDLSNLGKIRSFVKDWEARAFPSINTLILNAGLQFPEGIRKTDDGIEATFGINHVGHALLSLLLLPHMANEARIVLTSSGTHDPDQANGGFPPPRYTNPEELAYPAPEDTKIDGRWRYATSKLANVLWTYALQRRFAASVGKSITVNAFDPGLMPGTGLGREYSGLQRWIWNNILPHILPLLRLIMFSNIHSPQESGQNLAWLATSADSKGVSGEYYESRKRIKSSVESYDERKQDELWEWTVRTVAINPEEAIKFQKAV
ncbi:dehydrogenase/reductase [Rhexocercosporidium sp. MPI-PUGE-AT-0058]|nr:dehydrogenase/reductase [Rhexocercosporidium sp. MPI-PUGE-AT-0058]